MIATGLKRALAVGDNALSVKESAMLATTKGPVNAGTFVGLLERAARKNTIDVTFPGSLSVHLAHGDTLGICGNGM